MRYRSFGAVAALVAAGLGIGMSVTWSSGASAPPPAVPTYGSKTGMTPPALACGNSNIALVAAEQVQVRATGITKIRCDLSWWRVQPTDANSWNWGDYDNVVNVAAYLGIDVLFVPQFTPPWARPSVIPPGTSNPSHIGPRNIIDYVRFVHEATARYAPNGPKKPAGVLGSVNKWEIWNEPNITGFWNPVDPVRYSQVLSAAVVAIKWVDPTATVISGGLAPAGNINGNYAPDSFTYVMALTGALSLVDGVAIHPYTFPAYPSEKLNFNPLVNHTPRMYNVMKTFGAGSKKIWATEAGWPTSSQAPETTRWDGSQVGTEPIQALAMYDLLRTWNKASYAGPMYLYAQEDKCTNLKSWLCMMGIQRTDGSKKPAYKLLTEMLVLPIG